MTSQLVTVDVVAQAPASEPEFDYNMISDPIQRDWAESAAGMISFGLGQAVVKVLEAGSLLSEAKRRLPHGEYLPWVQQACGLKPSYAAKLIKAAELVNVEHVPHLTSCTDVATLFLLSADTTTEEVREWFMERCAAGDPPSRKEVQERKRSSQGQADRTLEQEVLSVLKLSPEARSLAAQAEHISTRQLMDVLDVEELPKGKRHQTADAVYCRNGSGWWKLPIQALLPVVAVSESVLSVTENSESQEQHVSIAYAVNLVGFKSSQALRNILTPSRIKRYGFPVRNGYRLRPSDARGMCYIAPVSQ